MRGNYGVLSGTWVLLGGGRAQWVVMWVMLMRSMVTSCNRKMGHEAMKNPSNSIKLMFYQMSRKSSRCPWPLSLKFRLFYIPLNQMLEVSMT